MRAKLSTVEALDVHRRHAGNAGARWGCEVPAELGPRRLRGATMLRKIMYSLGALAVLAMAVGAGFRPN